MAKLQSVGRKILTYISPRAKEQSAYFKITRDICEAQFYLGNRFQEIYLWQEVADRDMEVSRIENLLYGCFSMTTKRQYLKRKENLCQKIKSVAGIVPKFFYTSCLQSLSDQKRLSTRPKESKFTQIKPQTYHRDQKALSCFPLFYL